MMTTKGMGRRSSEEKRHGGCAEKKGRTLAQQERRSGRKGPQACKASSVRFPERALPGKRRDWLQRQDSNLRHRNSEPRGINTYLRSGKAGAPSFCGLHIGRPEHIRPLDMSGNPERLLKSEHVFWWNRLPLRHGLRCHTYNPGHRASATSVLLHGFQSE
jgi:hypothetical protein